MLYYDHDELIGVMFCRFFFRNLDGLVEMAWEYLDLVRVYTKPKGKLPDFNEPVVLHRGRCSIEDFCNKVWDVWMRDIGDACGMHELLLTVLHLCGVPLLCIVKGPVFSSINAHDLGGSRLILTLTHGSVTFFHHLYGA